MNTDERRLIAVDVGNARTKLGLFADLPDVALPQRAGVLPEPEAVLSIDNQSEFPVADLAALLTPLGHRPTAWWIASVNRSAATRLVDWLRANRPNDPIHHLTSADIPLRVDLLHPEQVGIDRLLDALAANHLRRPDHPAIVVDVGTATTVDLVSADGAFRGGAILPGLAMSARALHEFTDQLPLVETSPLATPPPPLGTSTETAIAAGLFWGTVGAIRELIGQMTATLPPTPDKNVADPDLFLTGGLAPALAPHLALALRHLTHLTLAAIALAGRRAIYT